MKREKSNTLSSSFNARKCGGVESRDARKRAFDGHYFILFSSVALSQKARARGGKGRRGRIKRAE